MKKEIRYVSMYNKHNTKQHKNIIKGRITDNSTPLLLLPLLLISLISLTPLILIILVCDYCYYYILVCDYCYYYWWHHSSTMAENNKHRRGHGRIRPDQRNTNDDLDQTFLLQLILPKNRMKLISIRWP